MRAFGPSTDDYAHEDINKLHGENPVAENAGTGQAEIAVFEGCRRI